MEKCTEPIIKCGWRSQKGYCIKNLFAPCPSGKSHDAQVMLNNYWFGEPIDQKGTKVIWEEKEDE